jgi:hypothetical protein
MSYCRTTLIEYRSEQDADDLIFTYKQNAATDFPDAEILQFSKMPKREPKSKVWKPTKEMRFRYAERLKLAEDCR